MSGFGAVALSSLAAGAIAFVLLWLLSLRLRDASIVDVFWGLAFALYAGVAYAVGDGASPRAPLVLALAIAWGGRLAAHLAWRNAGKGEDFRYQEMRRRHGERFGLTSLATVFGLQWLLSWVVSLPLQRAVSAPLPAGLGVLDAVGVALFVLGFAFESVGDWQLARFKADPANAGRVMDRGLWSWTRHPNYFGDACVWWGFFAFAAATPGGVLLAASPALMTFLLLRVSGVALLERDIGKRRPDYADYVARTSAFLPWPPRARPPSLSRSR